MDNKDSKDDLHKTPRTMPGMQKAGISITMKLIQEQLKPNIAILISDKIDFKIKAVKRDKGGHYIMIKGPIQEEDTTIINICAPNTGAPQYVRLTRVKGETNNITVTVGDSNTHSHLWIDPLNRKLTRKHKL